MNTILLVVIQISVSTSISLPNIVATVHRKQESANVLSCMEKTFNHYAIQKENPSDRMPLSTSQIRALCIATAIPTISDKTDGKSLVISISYPSTSTAKYTTISWSWWRVTESVHRQNMKLRYSTAKSTENINSPNTIVTVPIAVLPTVTS
jgi:hypothetical protein